MVSQKELDPITVTVREAQRVSGWGRLNSTNSSIAASWSRSGSEGDG